jgi:diguanylate cyclase (GGDEF)-like protein
MLVRHVENKRVEGLMAGGAKELSRSSAKTSAKRDMVGMAIVIASLMMFAGTATNLTRNILDHLGSGEAALAPERALGIAVMLNLALILFGWRRYRDLAHEIDVRTAAEERAQALASKDPLTGLLNRRSLNEEGSSLLIQAGKRQKQMAMMVVDLDNFKNVNDVHGHMVGDQLIRAVAEAIQQPLPPSAIAARLGGDEYAVAFLYDESNPGVVNTIANDLVQRLTLPFDVEGVRTHISASIGIARSDNDCSSVDALLRRADIAMYSAKKHGRNAAVWFNAGMERELKLRNAIEAGLRAGVPKGEFVPYYEQQIEISTGELHGFEVLARWEHPTEGTILPEVFIPIAEECGMIGDLSMSVMEQAFIEARDWDPHLMLSVNISPTQFKDPWLAQKIVKLLVATGFPPNRLEVEITESSLYENLPLAQSIVGSLKNQGIKLSLDDFGTGYSSLAHLRALPFDRIKIDRSFVTSIKENSESDAIVNAITKLAESLGLPITAEGIETEAIRDRLREIGCRDGQGWHYGKPQTIASVRQLLAERGMLPTARAPEPETHPPLKTARRDR